MTREYPYNNLGEYLAELERRELLTRVSRPIDKDSELVPLVRLQFRGLPEPDRRAFFFEEISDGRGRQFDATVSIATFAANRRVYAAAVGVEDLAEIGGVWHQALSAPIDPVEVASGPCKDVVITDPDELEASGGVDAFPHPISTPGFDPAPFLTAGCWISRDPEDGTYNSGVYRGMIKGPRRVGLQMDTPSQHIAIQLARAKKLGVKLEVAIVVGAVPAVALSSVQKVAYGVNELAIAGGLMGRPLEVVRCETVDLHVPASAELIIEGSIDPTKLELEGPFGEASGFMGPRTISPYLDVTAITHRKRPIVQAFISEFPPSESTLMRKLGFENVYRRFLRESCNLASVQDVCFYEMATCNMMFAIRMRDPSPGQAWQALYAAAGYEPSMGKIIVAVDEDIDLENLESLVWALAFRTQPRQDVRILDSRLARLDPSLPADPADPVRADASAMLIDATRAHPYPPTSLPSRESMLAAQEVWRELGLPALELREPWSGYELGAWDDQNRIEAERAVRGAYLETGTEMSTS
jgi:4-hydroxy-3-polyprenylbenzoate decarboxylase